MQTKFPSNHLLRVAFVKIKSAWKFMSMTVPDLDLTTTQINSMYAYDENRMEDFIMFEAGLEVRLLFVDGPDI